MSNPGATIRQPDPFKRRFLFRLINAMSTPVLALLTAFILGGLVIWITTGSLTTVKDAYVGLVRGAFFKQRGLSETLVATIPYMLLALGVAVGFKTGLFNIGVEGQFTIGSLCAAWAGQAFHGLPAIIHLPLTIGAGALGGGIWAAIPGYLKAKTGAHEVITTIMMNYVSFRFLEFMVSGALRDPYASAIQTPRIDPAAELWTLAAVPERLTVPINALFAAVLVALVVALIVRMVVKREKYQARLKTPLQRRGVYLGVALVAGLVTFVGLPPLTQAWWPFKDAYDRMHLGILLALGGTFFVWWFMGKTTTGFELRTVGANPNAARYAGINITRNIVLAMFISGALAGIAGTVEVLGVSICRCLPMIFVSGYGFDSIAIALLAKNNPFGIMLTSFLFGAMRNGADLMELNSGVSKYVISLVQALILMFSAAPAMVRWLYRIKTERRLEDEAPLARGWGG